SPSCGFCQQMLDDVKRWERSNGFDVPDLLVVSGGSADANRRQGFRSRVVLDPSFRVGNAFGAGGTPSAVLIDEDGTVASAVAVGGQRPEVPDYVDWADPISRSVLRVRPGITDPMTLRLRNEEELMAGVVSDREAFYRTRLRPFKLQGYKTYLATRSWLSDVL